MVLYHKVTSGFEKLAMSKHKLSDNPDQWANEMMAQLYSQHGYLGRFSVNMEVDGEDRSRGYLYGKFLIEQASQQGSNPEEMSGGMMNYSAPQPHPEQAPPPEARELRIPIIVEEGKLFPFDVFIDTDGKFHYLTEDNLSVSLFEGNDFQVETKKTQGLSGYPEQQANPGVPGGRMSAGANRGQIEKSAALLPKVLCTIPRDQRVALVREAETDPFIILQLEKNAAFALAMGSVASTPYMEPATRTLYEKLAHSAYDEEYDVAVLQATEEGYNLTLTSRDMFAPVTYMDIEREKLAQLPTAMVNEALETGASMVCAAPRHQEIHVSANVDQLQNMQEYCAVIDHNGVYKEAAVIHPVYSVSDGSELNLTLAVWADGASLQEKVAGLPLPHSTFDSTAMRSPTRPHGQGVLVFEDGKVSEPISVHHHISHPDGDQMVVSNTWGREMTLQKTAGVLRPIKSGDKYLIPDSCTFAPLPALGGSTLAADPELAEKLAFAHEVDSSVIVWSPSRGKYTFEGTRGIEKLAKEHREELDRASALFILGSLGLSGRDANEKLAKASEGREVQVVPGYDIIMPETTSNQWLPFSAHIEDLSTWMPKIASVITDSQTIDAVLSLGFVTPETMSDFVEHIPTFKEVSSKLAELLIGARLGTPSVPESAVRSALKSLEKVIKGLEDLAVRVEGGDG